MWFVTVHLNPKLKKPKSQDVQAEHYSRLFEFHSHIITDADVGSFVDDIRKACTSQDSQVTIRGWLGGEQKSWELKITCQLETVFTININLVRGLIRNGKRL